MHKLKFLAIATLAFASLANAAVAEENKYTIEPNHTHILWTANHFGFSNQNGKFSDIEGSIVFDEANPQASAVDVTIKIASLNTGLTKFDQHLKSADFFNVEKFANAKFVSKKITVTGKKTAKIEGDLTLLGITKQVTLNTKFNKSGISVITQKQTIGFTATATIKRSDFGMTYGVPGVSDAVNLIIEVEANR